MSQALPLGFFQFDNLVRNKVPFFLLKTTQDAESLFGPLEKLHLRNYSISLPELNLESVHQELKNRGVAKETPIVTLCDDGKISEKVAHELAKAGFLNIYFVLEGFKGLQDNQE